MAEYREIPLTQNKVALVDAVDYDWLMQWNWYAHWCSGAKSFYVYRVRSLKSGLGRGTVALHRAIMDVMDSKVHVDHINHDTLDNRRANLRLATPRENTGNGRLHRDNVCGLKGVSRAKSQTRPYMARIRDNGKLKYLGCFLTPEEAHAAYMREALRIFGEFACSGVIPFKEGDPRRWGGL